MTTELMLIETTIKKGDALLGKAISYEKKSLEMKTAAGLTYIEARTLCENAGLSFKDELHKFTTISRSQVYKVMQIAAAKDPAVEEQRQRDTNAAQNAAYRARKDDAVSHVRDTIQMRNEEQRAWNAEREAYHSSAEGQAAAAKLAGDYRATQSAKMVEPTSDVIAGADRYLGTDDVSSVFGDVLAPVNWQVRAEAAEARIVELEAEITTLRQHLQAAQEAAGSMKDAEGDEIADRSRRSRSLTSDARRGQGRGYCRGYRRGH
jgi:hypothetical protein